LERMFAVAVRDGDDLFLWIRLRRAARTDIYYMLPTGREDHPEWKNGTPTEVGIETGACTTRASGRAAVGTQRRIQGHS
jgi:hypothetical protein